MATRHRPLGVPGAQEAWLRRGSLERLTIPGGKSPSNANRTNRPTAGLVARPGAQCSMNGTACWGVTGRIVAARSLTASEAVVRIQSTSDCAGHFHADKSVSASSTIVGRTPATRSARFCASVHAGNNASLCIPSVSAPRSDSTTASRPVRRWPVRNPTIHGSPQYTALTTPVIAGTGPQVIATSMVSSAIARSKSKGHIRRTCSSTPGASACKAATR